MVKSTIIARVSDGLPLAASMDDEQVRVTWVHSIVISLTCALLQVETELAEYKAQAKTIFKRLNAHSEPRCSIESGAYVFQYERKTRIRYGDDTHLNTRSSLIYSSYIIESNACYLCICDKSYPRKLAFSYLEELVKEFNMSYGSEVDKPSLRPYAFVKFGMLLPSFVKGGDWRDDVVDTFMQKTKRIYQDTRTQNNLTKLNEDLQDVTRIMTKNMEDLLWRGDSLDRKWWVQEMQWVAWGKRWCCILCIAKWLWWNGLGMSQYSGELKDSAKMFKDKARHLNLQALVSGLSSHYSWRDKRRIAYWVSYSIENMVHLLSLSLWS